MGGTLKGALILSILGPMASSLSVGAPAREMLPAKVDTAIRQQMTAQRIPGLSLAVVQDGKTIKATAMGRDFQAQFPVNLFHSPGVQSKD